MSSILAPLLISGYLTFWSRPSSTDIPRPTAPSQKVEETLTPTVKPGTTSRLKVHFVGQDLEGDFQMFYMQPNEQKPYIVTQVDLSSSSTHEPLGQCSSYHSIEDSIPMPVGSCSVFVKKDGVTQQVGVSFSRIPLSSTTIETLQNGPAPEYNLFIEYCSTKDPSSCKRIFNNKAVAQLEKKGFHIVDSHATPETIVIQLHDGCTYFEICEPQLYGREAIIRLQDTRTYQIHYERSLKKMIYPVTSKALLNDIIALFDPFAPKP